MAFTQLIYVSDLVNQKESELGRILESSVRHNREDGITGMMLYSSGNILQVLEGEKERVHRTYERISRDPRHSNLIVLNEEEIPERHFSSWSMGYRQLRADDLARFPDYAPYFHFGFNAADFNARPGVALEMLKVFSKAMT